MSEAKSSYPAVNKVMVIGAVARGAISFKVLLRDSRFGLIPTLVDPDIVEEKNVSRQNFSPDEVGGRRPNRWRSLCRNTVCVSEPLLTGVRM